MSKSAWRRRLGLAPHLAGLKFELCNIHGAQLPIDLHDEVRGGAYGLSDRHLRLIRVIDRDLEKLVRHPFALDWRGDHWIVYPVGIYEPRLA